MKKKSTTQDREGRPRLEVKFLSITGLKSDSRKCITYPHVTFFS